MQVKNLKIIGDWETVRDAAVATSGVIGIGTTPSGTWKRRIMMAEHSPIRLMSAEWTWVDLPYWVSTHFVRHHVGCDHFVQSQRVNSVRGESPQSAPVIHRMRANFQAIINISRQRLCSRAATATQCAWLDVMDQISYIEPILFELSVAQCVDGVKRTNITQSDIDMKGVEDLNKKMSNESEHFIDGARCPYCGHVNDPEHSDYILYREETTEYDCGMCGKEFYVNVLIDYHWRTEKKRS